MTEQVNKTLLYFNNSDKNREGFVQDGPQEQLTL